jgi:hypothetical protein
LQRKRQISREKEDIKTSRNQDRRVERKKQKRQEGANSLTRHAEKQTAAAVLHKNGTANLAYISM